MNFSRLKQADDRDIEKWLKENLNITDYDYRKMRDNELIRFSPFYFYEQKKIKKHNFLWRLTAPFFLLFCLLVIIAMPFKWLITGNRYLSQKFLDTFYYRWQEKMGW